MRAATLGGVGGWSWGVRLTRSCPVKTALPAPSLGTPIPVAADSRDVVRGPPTTTPRSRRTSPPARRVAFYRPRVAFAMMLRWISLEPA
jgi:hypothetical protein